MLLNSVGTLTNTVTGLINGVDTRINAGTVDNAGRIYGDVLRMNAGTFTNRGTGVVAARHTQLAGVKHLNNNDGGLIYSLGDLGIGGGIDPTGALQGAAQSLFNALSRIEAAGRMAIFADMVVNRNDGLVTRQVTGAPVSGEFVQPIHNPSRYPIGHCFGIGGGQGDNSCVAHPAKYGQRSVITPVYSQVERPGWTEERLYDTVINYAQDSPMFARFEVTPAGMPPIEPASGCSSKDGHLGTTTLVDTPQCKQWLSDLEVWTRALDDSLIRLDTRINAYNAAVNEDNRIDIFEDYTRYKLVSTTSRTEIVSTAPGQILSGGSMQLSGSVTNRDSQIVAGGRLTIVGPEVKNIATQGETRTSPAAARPAARL